MAKFYLDWLPYQIPNVESTPSLLPVFKCNFDDIPHVTYVYDVYWYINGNNVTSYRNISYSNISTTVFKGVWYGIWILGFIVVLFSFINLQLIPLSLSFLEIIHSLETFMLFYIFVFKTQLYPNFKMITWSMRIVCSNLYLY
jgi:hypothetical protein